MILAGIDIGTNTLRLLVAETGPGSIQEIHTDRRTTRLGQGLDRSGALSREGRERSLKALGDFAVAVRAHAASRTAAIGTSALRMASDAREFIAEVKQTTGLDINVVSGEEEARLTLLGVGPVLKGLRTGDDNAPASALIIDIGGGSTEVIRTRTADVPVMTSLPLGAVSLTERFIKNDPPTAEEMELLRLSVRDVLNRQRGMLIPGPPAVLVGTAGTITTLAAMDLKLADYAPEKINGRILTRETVREIVQTLCASPLEERRSMPGLEQGREDIIPAGAVLTQEIMEWSGFTSMVVSDWGLREGIVMDLFDRVNKMETKFSHEGMRSDECKMQSTKCKSQN